MAILKCKMCGGDIEVLDQSYGECDSCGSKTTLPKIDDERKANLFNRANHFRRQNDFDKAVQAYENILNEDNNDAEAHWGLVLSKYGIEYVEDSSSHKRLPTCHRVQSESILIDADYLSAVENAPDGYSRSIYEEEAKAISEIQKGILSISNNEKPYDVFICYKESSESGTRTKDSTMAQEIYYQLTNEGFKVFFSRITLEDKLGAAYEPYIFAALNSAKVMLVIGTKSEYINAPWVKNEWSRYLKLLKADHSKLLIPCYADMDAYDLPEELSMFQSQDMTKIGFVQDLIRGVKKVLISETKKEIKTETAVSSDNASTGALLKRAFMFLEDKEFTRADSFFEQVLNLDPENAQAYLGKLMAELNLSVQDDLKNQAQLFDTMNNYKKAIRFGDSKLKSTMQEYIDFINDRNETARKDEIYSKASKLVSNSSVKDNETAIQSFERILEWKDSAIQIEICRKNIEEIKAKEEADRLEKECQAEIARKKAEKLAKKIKKNAMIVTPIAVVCIAFIILLNTVIIPQVKYNNATDLLNNGDYVGAATVFAEITSFKDSKEKIPEIVNNPEAMNAIANNPEAYAIFKRCQIKAASVGDIVYYGKYEQDNNTANGKELTEWIVLKKQDNKALIISEYALDAVRYNTSTSSVTWETCTLRKWLNNEFLNRAFTEEEQKYIVSSTISNPDNSEYDIEGGNNTTDKVFLLSIAEVNKYFTSNSERRCEATKYAVEQGAYVDINTGFSWWWLRSPGNDSTDAADVNPAGVVDEGGYDVGNDSNAVRPVLWINLES